MNLLKQLEQEQITKLTANKDIPDFGPGDTVIVNVKVVEGERSRLQAYEGVCIARSGGGINQSFTVRKISYGEGVERVFPLYSPMVDSIKVVRRGKVRRAKLYYLRGLRGKKARITEKQDQAAPRRRSSARWRVRRERRHRPARRSFRRAFLCTGWSSISAPGSLRTNERISMASPAPSTTRSGTTMWSISSRTAPACSTSTAISSMR